MGKIIAVDIGGTQMRGALFNPDNTDPIKHKRITTHDPNETPFERLVTVIRSVWPDEPVSAISVAAPGPLDPQAGIILSTPNIPGWENYPLVEKLIAQFNLPTYLGNDANLAALGEWHFGAGRGHHDVLYLTVSTGIGGGVISNDRLLLGARGLAAELGHITVMSNGPLCSCGQRGHLEAIASGPSIAQYVAEQRAAGRKSSLKAGNLTARQVAEAAQQGDALAGEAFIRAGEYLGQAIADFLHMFDPSIVILGGGVTQSGRLFLDTMKDSVRRHVMDPNFLTGLVFSTAQLGDNAGLLGALVQAQLKLEGK
ncbi:MAG: ROK family protein [Anaerolineales bacterium]|nr:ROK family protein [Anaerolineales bacterium]